MIEDHLFLRRFKKDCNVRYWHGKNMTFVPYQLIRNEQGASASNDNNNRNDVVVKMKMKYI